MSDRIYQLQAVYYATKAAGWEMRQIAVRLRQAGATGLATDAEVDAQKWEERERAALTAWCNERARTETPPVKHDPSFP